MLPDEKQSVAPKLPPHPKDSHVEGGAVRAEENVKVPRYGSTGNPMAFQAAKPPLRNFTLVNPRRSARRKILRLVSSLGHVQ